MLVIAMQSEYRYDHKLGCAKLTKRRPIHRKGQLEGRHLGHRERLGVAEHHDFLTVGDDRVARGVVDIRLGIVQNKIGADCGRRGER